MLKEFGNIVTMAIDQENFTEEMESVIVAEQVKELKEKFGDKLKEETIVYRSLPDMYFKNKKTEKLISFEAYNSPLIDKSSFEAVEVMLVGVKAKVEVGG